MQTSLISSLTLQIKPLLEKASPRGHVLPPSCPAPSSEERSIPVISLQSNAGICTGLQGLDCSYLGCSLAASATGFFGGLWLERKERALHARSCRCLLLQLEQLPCPAPTSLAGHIPPLPCSSRNPRDVAGAGPAPGSLRKMFARSNWAIYVRQSSTSSPSGTVFFQVEVLDAASSPAPLACSGDGGSRTTSAPFTPQLLFC